MDIGLIAATVAVASASIALGACVLSVIALRRCSEAVSRTRSTASLHAELIEIRDYMTKVDAWMKRISQREVMRERREVDGTIGPANGSVRSRDRSAPVASESHKDALRRRAGLTAGKPAQHNNDGEIDQ